jgi:hypothetical protein
MSAKNLRRLQKVDLREAWSSESSGFTPWLLSTILDRAFNREL